jgi:hypothetical protein
MNKGSREGTRRPSATAARWRPTATREARRTWFVALWDGLQVQWLYDREAVDVADELRTRLETILLR